MDTTLPPRGVLSFPKKGGEEPPRPNRWTPEAWPPFPLEEETPPSNLPTWLEAQVSAIAIEALRFKDATKRLGTIDLAAVTDQIDDFSTFTDKIIRAVELLRLRHLDRQNVAPLVDGVKRATEHLRQRRLSILHDLELDPQRGLLVREERIGTNLRDLDQAIASRAMERQVTAHSRPKGLVVAGSMVKIPTPEALAAKTRRKWRHNQDHLPVDPEASIASLLLALPDPWQNGIALRLIGKPLAGDAVALANLLIAPRHQRDVLRALPIGSRRILETLLQTGGVSRYDHITHSFGPDDETAWFWPLDPPRSDLERLRRAAFVHSGTADMFVGPRRIAFIPAEIRDSLKRLLDEHPPPPVSLRGNAGLRL